MVLALNLAVGAALLLLGRKLFWLFVAGLGFILALRLAMQFMPNAVSNTPAIVIALIVGLIGALMARFIQRLAVRLAGFLAGALIAITAIQYLAIDAGLWTWAIALLAGLIGALMATWLFGWALVIVSSIIGAGVIAVSLNLPANWAVPVFTAAAVVGVFVQSGWLRGGFRRRTAHYS